MEQITSVIHQVVLDLYDIDTKVVVSRPDEQFGDFSTNTALQLAKQLGKAPRAVAEEIAAVLTDKSIGTIEIAGPGFINIRLAEEILVASALDALNKPQLYAGKTVVVEYSDMNAFKQSHIGHLYSTIVGDVIARLIEQGGATVHRANFGGDVGLHAARTMWGILQLIGGEKPDELAVAGNDPKAQTAWLSGRYIEGNRAYETDEAAKQEIIDLNKKLYDIIEKADHESPLAQIFWTCRSWCYDFFKVFYDEISVTQFEKYYPESETAPVGLRVVREQLAKGVYKESDGAIVFDGEPYDLHTRVFINNKGLPTYEAKDVGLSIQKWEDYHFDESVIITGNDIIEYMKVVLKSIEQFEPELAHRTVHITHGNVKLAGGVKMSSRLGNGLSPDDALNAARAANEAATGKKDEAAVLGAVKYSFLKTRIGADLIYDAQESVSTVGNSGPYLQYAHARARSILKKSTVSATTPTDLTDAERRLVRQISLYPEVVAIATREHMPHHICTYLYELAQTFNQFYEHSLVVGDPREAQRVTIVTTYADVLRDGLQTLGIVAPDSM